MIICKLLPTGETPWRHSGPAREIKVSADTERKALERIQSHMPAWARMGKTWTHELDGSLYSILWIELRMKERKVSMV